MFFMESNMFFLFCRSSTSQNSRCYTHKSIKKLILCRVQQLYWCLRRTKTKILILSIVTVWFANKKNIFINTRDSHDHNHTTCLGARKKPKWHNVMEELHPSYLNSPRILNSMSYFGFAERKWRKPRNVVCTTTTAVRFVRSLV